MTPEALDSLGKKELIGLVLTMADQIAALQARVAELEARLDVPPKTPDNSSLPPSRGQKENRPEKPSKKRRKGHLGAARKLAGNPDRTRDIYADKCDECSRELTPEDHSGVHAYDHIDIPPIEAETTRVNLHKGRCPCCDAPFKAKAPADMAPGSPFGPNIAAIVTYLHARHMVSYNRLVEIMKALFGLDISEGALSNMLERAATPFAAEGERIEAEVRVSKVIAADETTARVMGTTCWQWVFSSDKAVSHRIAATRAKAVVADFLRGARPQVWVSDRYAAQMGHAEAHQVCLAHILRDVQYAIDAGDEVFAPGFKFLLKRALAIARRREKLADSTLAAYSRDLKRRLDRLLARQPDTVAGRKLRNGMERARDKLFVFVTRRDVPATNNVSERLLRPSVIFRKVTNGFRSVWGAQVYADICSVIATGALNGLHALDAIRACLKGRSVIAVV
ncbi:MAG: IS66 family transposase [Proteobacteria bacterium]|nr:IS66 family transposase [Pseudomonadota bacterium]